MLKAKQVPSKLVVHANVKKNKGKKISNVKEHLTEQKLCSCLVYIESKKSSWKLYEVLIHKDMS